MKTLLLTILLASSSAFAFDLPTLDFMDMEKSITKALVVYAQDVVGMEGPLKMTDKGLFKTTTTVTEMASGCSFAANVVLRNGTWVVVEKQNSNTCN